MLLLPVISQPGAKLALLDCAWVREKERVRQSEKKGKERVRGERCCCAYASWALGHDTKLPLNQAAVGCRTDIIFNEIITYTQKNALVRECTFNAADLGKCCT